MSKIKSKQGQEEMVGFAMIIIIVAVVILILLGIALNKPETTSIDSYEVGSFIQASLQHTTDCSTDGGQSYNDIENLISECDFEQICDDGRNACSVLDSELKKVTLEAWRVGENRPVKGYVLNITLDGNSLLSVSEGNETNNYKGASQPLPKRGTVYNIEFRAYY